MKGFNLGFRFCWRKVRISSSGSGFRFRNWNNVVKQKKKLKQRHVLDHSTTVLLYAVFITLLRCVVPRLTATTASQDSGTHTPRSEVLRNGYKYSRICYVCQIRQSNDHIKQYVIHLPLQQWIYTMQQQVQHDSIKKTNLSSLTQWVADGPGCMRHILSYVLCSCSTVQCNWTLYYTHSTVLPVAVRRLQLNGTNMKYKHRPREPLGVSIGSLMSNDNSWHKIKWKTKCKIFTHL